MTKTLPLMTLITLIVRKLWQPIEITNIPS